MSSEFIFLAIIVPAYTFMWLVMSAFFTRHWVTNQKCVAECTRREDLFEVTGNHAAECQKWDNHPLEPAEAMLYSIAWPLTFAHYVLTYVHRYDPPPKPGKSVKLTQKHIAYLDSVLENQEIKELKIK